MLDAQTSFTQNHVHEAAINPAHFAADGNCIFCKIAAKTLPANVLYECADFIAFHDIKPAMPVHFLIIPKCHIAMLSDLGTSETACAHESMQALMGKMLLLAPKLAKQQGLSSFKLALHNGQAAGQEVFHLHLHVMGQVS